MLVAGEQRLPRYRHPTPSQAAVGQCAMLVFCARRNGLYANLTRFVSFGKASSRQHDIMAVEAAALAACMPGQRLSAVYRALEDAYRRTGEPRAIRQHHQGGITGYLARELIAAPATSLPLACGMAVAFNPSFSGIKMEDTFLLEEGGLENLTCDPAWPAANVEGRLRPLWLEVDMIGIEDFFDGAPDVHSIGARPRQPAGRAHRLQRWLHAAGGYAAAHRGGAGAISTDEHVLVLLGDSGDRPCGFAARRAARRRASAAISKAASALLEAARHRGSAAARLCALPTCRLAPACRRRRALEVATLRALRSLLSFELDDVALALLAQRAEIDYAQVNCGIMDQMASSLCRQRAHAVHRRPHARATGWCRCRRPAN